MCKSVFVKYFVSRISFVLYTLWLQYLAEMTAKVADIA